MCKYKLYFSCWKLSIYPSWTENIFPSYTCMLICYYYFYFCCRGSVNFSHKCANARISKLSSSSPCCWILPTAAPSFVASYVPLMSGMHDSLGIPSQRAHGETVSNNLFKCWPSQPFHLLITSKYRFRSVKLWSILQPYNHNICIIVHMKC